MSALCLANTFWVLFEKSIPFSRSTRHLPVKLKASKFYICHLSPNLSGIYFCVSEEMETYSIFLVCVIMYLAPFTENFLLFPLICPASPSWVKFLYFNRSISMMLVILVNLSTSTCSHIVLITRASKQVQISNKEGFSVVIFLFLKYLGSPLLFTLLYTFMNTFLKCHEKFCWKFYWISLKP